MKKPGPHHIELYSGAYLDLLDPQPVMTVEDIAHGLSNICRYTGQCRFRYSVAEHAWIVATRLAELEYPPHVVFAGLHHDDSEAFIGDVATPLKMLLQPQYGKIEAAITAVIERKFEIPLLTDAEADALKEVDLWAMALETHALMRSRGSGWISDGLLDPKVPWPSIDVAGFGPAIARRNFLKAHHRFLSDLRTTRASPQYSL